ncbi:penicillin-binding transpeptidase domain-containing protein [Metabacillus fastidiosus]|uniref:penicillin-binding transpeptidase domain-containing protein n=1 Tax=Metabacillus fastidiosus TaxID=1458 RepID=UPI002DB833D9|nr:penicillin-binding transpeptidase domain-containing protein [Metabacillus fastidiosus]MEC2078065.1 penicillin-binding transpeptidase domain-containing protein [Metabacillus fastidiosus]
MKNNKLFIFVFMMMALCFLFIFGCSKEEKQDEMSERFSAMLSKQDYDKLYALLSNESKEYITEEDFVTRYTNIYSGIQANDINIKKDAIDYEKNVISFSIEMETAAGKVNISDYQLELVREGAEWRINWDERLIFPNMKKGDKVKVVTDKAIRGSILDRNGNPLAKDGLIKTVGINPKVFDQNNREEKIKELAAILDIGEENIIKKLDRNTNENYFVPIVDIQFYDEKLKKLQFREEEGIFINSKDSRVYMNHAAFGRLLGYVGMVTAEELEKNKEKGYSTTSLIGKAGLEQVYEDVLRGIDGAEIYIERDEEKVETIAKHEARNGQNIKLSIDSDLQTKIYDEMNGGKGSAAAVNPKTGEVLALVSSPSYNSNRYTTYITREEQQRRKESDFADEANRFSRLYSPGSTFKLITATTGLEKGTINPEKQISINGRSWRKDSSWGNYSITRVNNQKSVNLKDAVKYSDNIYFAMSALNLGKDDFINGARQFGIGEDLEIGYPLGRSQISNDGSIDRDILLADSGYGQGEVMVTSLDMALAYTVLSNDGNIMAPSLIQTEDQRVEVWKAGVISSGHLSILQSAFAAVIKEEGGTASAAKISGVQLAGKTGTAEIKASQDDGHGTENGWFIATDLGSSKISLAVVMEDVKGRGGSSVAIPIGKNVLSDYFKKR